MSGRTIRSLLGAFLMSIAALPAKAERVVPTDRVTNSVTIFTLPRGDSERVGRLLPGESLEFVRNEPGTRYRQVRRTDGQPGFVHKAFTKTVADSAYGASAKADDELAFTS
jgi:hypothetical protein